MMLRYAILENNIVKDIIEINNLYEQDVPVIFEKIFSNKKWVKETELTGKTQTSWIYKNNRFIMPSPYPSWILKDETWTAPIEYPLDNKIYLWNENDQKWEKFLEEND